MKKTKLELKEIAEMAKKEVDFRKKHQKKTTEVTRNDDGIIINKETGKPHFPELLQEKKFRDISISLSFGTCSPKLKEQLKKQGFKISNEILKDAENIRIDLHALNEVGILKSKELFKCFNRLSKKISKEVVKSEIKEGEIAIHKETIIG
jgi:hypothetical protein